jgi:hypothetical protein
VGKNIIIPVRKRSFAVLYVDSILLAIIELKKKPVMEKFNKMMNI